MLLYFHLLVLNLGLIELLLPFQFIIQQPFEPLISRNFHFLSVGIEIEWELMNLGSERVFGLNIVLEMAGGDIIKERGRANMRVLRQSITPRVDV